jgi:OmcA/MtrC family decaheme c-type cytochrome
MPLVIRIRIPTPAVMLTGRAFGAAVILLFAACEGPQGPEGVEGDAGPRGPRGEQGPLGPAGDPGRSPVVARSGFELHLEQATIDEDDVATATFRIADDADQPLDVEGRFSPGTISLSFVLAALTEDEAGGPGFYDAYTTREQTSPITDKTATQAAPDQGGTFTELEPGRYRYTFGTAAKVRDTSLTQTVGVYGERELDDESYVVDQELDFVPDGDKVSLRRDIVVDESCNACHRELSAHGGVRRGTRLCILCHTPQSSDPDTRNTVSFPIMIHKIHMGESLPTVQDGIPYEIIGYQQSVHDFSEIALPQPVNDCEACHGQAPRGQLAYQRPSRALCTSCHDNTAFAKPVPEGDTLHEGGPQKDDDQCAVCHPPSGGIAGLRDVHLVGLVDPEAPQLELTLDSIENTEPGDAPTITFSVSVDGKPRDIVSEPLAGLRATLAGPNTDYAESLQTTLQPGSSSTGTLTAIDTGQFEFEFPDSAAIPENARGSFTVALEGSIQPDGFPRLPALAPLLAFDVTGEKTKTRRTVVSQEQCDACHHELVAHGNMRRNVQYCPLCHNPNRPNDQGAPRFEDQKVFIQSLDFKVMIHRIHSGAHLTRQYVLGGYPLPTPDNPEGTPNDFSDVLFPQDLGNCTTCHVDHTYRIPLPKRLIPTIVETRRCSEDAGEDADDFCEDPFLVVEAQTLPPTAAVCTSCHDDDSSAVHAQTMTTSDGTEACATCHGPDRAFSVASVHANAP